MIDELPENMTIKPCIICGNPARPVHHVFPQTKRNRQKYGILLDLPFNKEYICEGCHVSHGAVGIPRYNDIEFVHELIKFLKNETDIFRYMK